MKRALKWIGITVGSLLVLACISATALYFVGRARLSQSIAVDVQSVPVDGDDVDLARGEHLVRAVSACVECHGTDLGGKNFFNDPALGTIGAPNLTSGRGGIATAYTNEEWVRAIRHGLDPAGRPLLVMPAQHFRNLSAEDLGAIIAYVESAPPVDNEPPRVSLTPLAYIMIALGQFDDLLPATYIPHDEPPPEAPASGPTAAYGEYLVSIATCRDCHGSNLNGGQAGPGDPVAPNLTPAGELSGWSQADFVRLIRSGETPSGRQLQDFMPWRIYRHMSDAELEAIWRYLQTVEPAPTPPELTNGG